MTTTGGDWAPYLPRPTAKQAAKQLSQKHTHGSRIQGVANARRLWSRLEEDIPRGPANPATGFSAEEAQYAKYGREYIRTVLEQTTTRAWQYWRPIRRAQIHGGGDEEDISEDYYAAVRQNKERQRRR